ncbi:hypothetical protein [Azospirillum lipoferum]|nr:hypothetical protein [Azospirillum lipoferum]
MMKLTAMALTGLLLSTSLASAGRIEIGGNATHTVNMRDARTTVEGNLNSVDHNVGSAVGDVGVKGNLKQTVTMRDSIVSVKGNLNGVSQNIGSLVGK